MRIDSKSPIAKAAAKARASRARASRGGDGFVEHIAGVTAGSDSVVATDQALPVETLLAVQQVQATNANSSQRDWARHWGRDVLTRLSQLREGMLIGNIPPERIVRLNESLAARKHDIEDPNLRQVIDEIELRARIEIAKLQRHQVKR